MNRTNVLVVDDEREIRESLGLALGDEFCVSEAATGEEAIQKLSKERVGLVLLDLRLPGISGLEVLNVIRTWQPNLPIVVFTGVTNTNTVVQAMKLGADDYITKPLRIGKLNDAMRKVLVARREAKGAERLWGRARDLEGKRDQLPADLPQLISSVQNEMLGKGASLAEARERFERELILLVLGRLGGDREKAGKALGVSPQRLSQRIGKN